MTDGTGDVERFTEPYQDPGWGVVFATRAGDEGLALMRRLFLALLVAPLVILVVVVAIFEDVGDVSVPLAAVVVGAGLFGITAATWTSRRTLRTDTPQALAADYRTGFFLGFALNEAPLLLSFALCFVEEAMWPYFIGIPLYLVGMSRIAPGPGNLARTQNRILSSGSSLQLPRALTARHPSRG